MWTAKPDRNTTREAYALWNPKGYIHTFWEDTGRLGIFSNERTIEELKEKRPELKKYEVVKVKIEIKT